MFRYPAACRILVAFALLSSGTGCGRSSSTAPSPPAALTANSIVPSIGLANTMTVVQIFGAGFQSGATVAFDDTVVTATFQGTTSIAAIAPARAAGFVQVTVTNPDAKSVRVPQGFTYARMSVTSVSPDHSMIGRWVRILGFGFGSETTVTFGDVQAATIPQTSNLLYALSPAHVAGAVDVVVKNPDGSTGTLPAGFTYHEVIVTANPSAVAAGAPLTVNWTASGGTTPDDWVGLFKVGDSSSHDLWYAYTKGVASGSFTVSAPSQPGEYEFRYFTDDGTDLAARSGTVTVTSPAPSNASLSSRLERSMIASLTMPISQEALWLTHPMR